MTRQKKLRWMLVALLACMGLLATSAPVNAEPQSGVALDGGCGAWLDSPHYSGGAGGVIVKTRYSCDLGFSMTVTGALSYLYYCGGTKPTGSVESTWTNSQGCRPVRSSNYSNFGVGSNQVVTRYTPAQGESGSSYKGWYIACTRYYRTGVSGSIRVWSPPADVTW